jgi:hypothetical protein
MMNLSSDTVYARHDFCEHGKGFEVIKYAAAALVAVSAVAGQPAFAQDCGDRDAFVAEFDTRYGEVPVAAGLQDAQFIVELWATQDGATWTILLTRVDGLTCVLAAGVGWSTRPEPVAVPGIDG